MYPLPDDAATARRRLSDAFAVRVDGIGLDELVGGCGVAESVLAVLDRAGLPHAGGRVALQGFGTMGGSTARFLRRAGLKGVAVADVHGTVANPEGLDVEALLASRDERGAIERSSLHPADAELPREAWLTADADVLVPAAVSYCIDAVTQSGITARYVVEAANMPVTPDAEVLLAERGITVLPDVVVNSGTNAWWWWTLFGDIEPDAGQAFTKVRSAMRRLVTAMLDRAESEDISPRRAAHALAEDRIALMSTTFGWYR